MNFNHTIPEWKNTGTEPSDSLKNSGFEGGMRPPAAVFNWFWAKVRNAITELQGNLSTVDDDVTAVENRATSLETRATNLESRATTAESDISGIKSVNTTQGNNISSLTTRATNLETRAKSAEDEIAAIKTVNTTQDGSLTALANRATSLETRATSLESGKVDKVSGKGLSANDFTDALKTKLDGIATGATKITVDSALSSTSENPVQNKAVDTALSNKVDKVSGKGLSTKDFTADAETKLNGIAVGATAVGKSLAGQSVMLNDGTTVVASVGAEIFNDYDARTVDGDGYAQTGNVASGQYSTARGCSNTSYGDYSETSGLNNQANGECARAYGQYSIADSGFTIADGYECYSNGTCARSHGYQAQAQSRYADANGYGVIANSFQTVFGKYNEERTGSSSYSQQSADAAIFSIGYGAGVTKRANAFTVFGDGACKGATFFGSTGADYPENYEWLDGNPNNEDRRGLFVTLDGEKIRLANAEDDYILGVISAMGGFVGNSPMEWHDKYIKDVFGARIQEEVTIPESVDEITGEVTPEHTAVQYVINPEYDPEREYITREARPEWAWVGLVGQIVVIDDGTCQVNSYCLPSKDGIATAAAKSAYRVMSRIDENHIKITIK